MKILKLFIIFLFGLLALTQCKSAKGVDVTITLSDFNGDATNSLNSVTKKTEGGKMTSLSDGIVNYEILHDYNIENSELQTDLKFKKKGSEDKNWSKKVAISADGESVYDPFPGITMKVIVKGN